ncbi:MAG: hypothetical protein V4636_16655 [Pseudomonadota bacterium]
MAIASRLSTFDDPHFLRRPYDRWQAYGQSKTANALFAVALDARGAPHNVRAFSVHPGSILTDLARHLSDDDLRAMGVAPGSAPGRVPEGLAAGDGGGGDYKTIAQGAATGVWCAANLQLEGRGGVYCEDVAPLVGVDVVRGARGVRAWAADGEAAERLWLLSASAP